MDFIEGLPKSHGYSVILVIVDTFTKYSHFIPLKHPYAAATVAQEVADHAIKLRSLPVTVTSDRDKISTSKFWQELFELSGTKLQMTTVYHPQMYG